MGHDLEKDSFFLISEINYIKNLVEENPDDYDLGNKIRKYFMNRKNIISKKKENNPND
jgi:hypothetical protein